MKYVIEIIVFALTACMFADSQGRYKSKGEKEESRVIHVEKELKPVPKYEKSSDLARICFKYRSSYKYEVGDSCSCGPWIYYLTAIQIVRGENRKASELQHYVEFKADFDMIDTTRR